MSTPKYSITIRYNYNDKTGTQQHGRLTKTYTDKTRWACIGDILRELKDKKKIEPTYIEVWVDELTNRKDV